LPRDTNLSIPIVHSQPLSWHRRRHAYTIPTSRLRAQNRLGTPSSSRLATCRLLGTTCPCTRHMPRLAQATPTTLLTQ
jgi:hypothetical protein